VKHTQPSSDEQSPKLDPDYNRLEIIRFASADAQRQAIRVLMDRGMLNFSSNSEDKWFVGTSIARKLRELAVPFEWLTEHA